MPHGARFVKKWGQAVCHGLRCYMCWCRIDPRETVGVV